MTEPSIRQRLDASLAAFDRERATTEALAALDAGSATVPELYRMLSDSLVRVGAAWQQGAAEVWQEHLMSGIVRTVVEACAPIVEARAPKARGGTIVLAAPPDEYHDLGLRMVTDLFTLAGWRAYCLGGNVPVAQVSAAVAELGADAVALSASTHFHRLVLKGYVADLVEAHPGLRVWVGGPAFTHEHDGWDDAQVLDPGSIPRAGEA
jgi:methanogenic corrinoid protein MtbC1